MVKQMDSLLQQITNAQHGDIAAFSDLVRRFQDIDVAKLLLQRGALVNAKSDLGAITPMHDAAFSGHAEMVAFLLAHGADPEARDTEFNATPLAWARFNGQDEVVALLTNGAPT